ncbi:hypothetical protein QTN25_007352 [Entamoeba marina]
MKNSNELIECLDQLVDKMSEKENSIHNKLMKSNHVNREELKEFEEKKQETPTLKRPYYDTRETIHKINFLIESRDEKKFSSLFNSKNNLNIERVRPKKVVYDCNDYNRDGYNRNGYDRNGHHKDGYNIYGYDRNGYDRNGYDRNGYDRNGYDRNGYDRNGYDRNGYDRDGYCRRSWLL